MKIERKSKQMKFIVSIIALLFAVAGPSVGAETDKEPFDLKVAIVLDAPKTTLAFTIKNNSQTTLEMAYPGVSGSPIIIVSPSGKVLEYGVHKSWAKLPTQLKPSESKTWKIDYIAALFKSYKLEELGLYKVSWKLAKWVSDEKRVEYKSNEILLVKEGD